MKPILHIACMALLSLVIFPACKTTRQINKVIAPKDSTAIVVVAHTPTDIDSIVKLKKTVDNLNRNHIDFKTFNAKIKVEYQDNKGKQPDITAIVRIVKDSAIWISLSATFLNIEVYRVLITKDSVVLLNKQDKEVQYRSLDYLQEVTEIPFDFKTVQDLIVGNPVFMDSTQIISYKQTGDQVWLLNTGKFFKHLLTLSANDFLLQHSKLDDIDVARNRTADITYSGYENKTGVNFSTYREITISEKNKLDIQLNFKQYEFNKDLSVSFNVPKNYKRK